MLCFTESGQGVPVVFLHGNPDSKESWQSIITQMDQQCRCIAIDLPGFGTNAKLPTYRSLLPDAQAHSLLEVLDHLSITEPILLVVHDLGALLAASMLITCPERVAGILSINTTFNRSYPGHIWGYVWALPVLGPCIVSLMRNGLVQSIHKESPLVPVQDLQRMADNLSWTTCRAITRYYQLMYNPLIKLARRFQGNLFDENFPIRVLWGAGDRYIPLKYAQLHNEPLHLVDDATHWLPLEKPELVIDEIKQLLVDL